MAASTRMITEAAHGFSYVRIERRLALNCWTVLNPFLSAQFICQHDSVVHVHMTVQFYVSTYIFFRQEIDTILPVHIVCIILYYARSFFRFEAKIQCQEVCKMRHIFLLDIKTFQHRQKGDICACAKKNKTANVQVSTTRIFCGMERERCKNQSVGHKDAESCGSVSLKGA